jgi:hypothetical protein
VQEFAVPLVTRVTCVSGSGRLQDSQGLVVLQILVVLALTDPLSSSGHIKSLTGTVGDSAQTWLLATRAQIYAAIMSHDHNQQAIHVIHGMTSAS